MATILLSIPHLNRTIAYAKVGEKTEKNSLKVLSYNVRVFNLYQYLKSPAEKEHSDAMVQWLTKQEVDVIAIQEYYENESSQVFNLTERMKKHGFAYAHVVARRKVKEGVLMGLATFSKYPIIHKKEILFENNKSNKAAHVVIKKGDDVFNVFNCHLESMNIDAEKVFETDAHYEQVKQEKVRLLKKLKRGFISRAAQAEVVLEEALKQKSNTIICGDFNDIPYSYTYTCFKAEYENAFEKAGVGLGFSYNHTALFFLRIDHQFFSKDLDIKSFETLRNVKYSDHFPLVAEYQLQ